MKIFLAISMFCAVIVMSSCASNGQQVSQNAQQQEVKEQEDLALDQGNSQGFEEPDYQNSQDDDQSDGDPLIENPTAEENIQAKNDEATQLGNGANLFAQENQSLDKQVNNAAEPPAANPALDKVNEQIPVPAEQVNSNEPQSQVPPPQEVPAEDLLPLLATLTWVGYHYDEKASQVKIELITKGSPKYDVFKESNQAGQAELVIRFFETGLRKKVRRDMNAMEFRSPIAYIRMRGNLEERFVDVILTLREEVQPRLFAKDGNILLTYDIPDHYKPLKGGGKEPGAKAEVLSSTKILPFIESGSRLPVSAKTDNAYVPDPALAVFRDAPVNGGDLLNATTQMLPQEVNSKDNADNNWRQFNESFQENNQGNNASGSENNAKISEQKKPVAKTPDQPKPENSNENISVPSEPQEHTSQQSNSEADDGETEPQTEPQNQENNDDSLDNYDDKDESNELKFEVYVPHSPIFIGSVAQDNEDDQQAQNNSEDTADETVSEQANNVQAAEPSTSGPSTAESSTAEPPTSEPTTTDSKPSDALTTDIQPQLNSQSDSGETDTVPVDNPENFQPAQDLQGQTTEVQSSSVNSKPIKMEFFEAPLGLVLKTFGQEGGTNFIYPQEIADRKVSINLRNVPWEEALKAILETYGLAMAQIGDKVIRIDEVDKMNSFLSRMQTAKSFKVKSMPTKVLVMRLSYAQATKIAETVDRFLTNDKIIDPRVNIRYEERTNSLFVEATENVLSKVKTLVERLDQQTPQVEIMSRIVEVSRNINDFLGIAWGGLTNYDQSRGLGFGSMIFPNSLTGNFAVDPNTGAAANIPGQVNLKVGSINDVFDLDLRLRMEERRGTTEILQSNRVVVDDRKQAKIRAGTTDFFRQQISQVVVPSAGSTSGGGGSGGALTSVEYMLELSVSPQVTADGMVIMDLNISSDVPTSLRGSADASSNNRQLQTTLLRRSGETVVIGGIYDTKKVKVVIGVPFLSSLPIIGALFRSTSNQESQTELLIMVTPKILNPSETFSASNVAVAVPGEGSANSSAEIPENSESNGSLENSAPNENFDQSPEQNSDGADGEIQINDEV